MSQERIEFEATRPLFLARFSDLQGRSWVVVSESQVEPHRFVCKAAEIDDEGKVRL